jgi:hypothetical protein
MKILWLSAAFVSIWDAFMDFKRQVVRPPAILRTKQIAR